MGRTHASPCDNMSAKKYDDDDAMKDDYVKLDEKRMLKNALKNKKCKLYRYFFSFLWVLFFSWKIYIGYETFTTFNSEPHKKLMWSKDERGRKKNFREKKVIHPNRVIIASFFYPFKTYFPEVKLVNFI